MNASLFAHIENDANLSGTFNLEGHYFVNTVKYLHDYLRELQRTEKVPAAYLQMLRQLSNLAATEEQIQRLQITSGVDAKFNLSDKIEKLAESITKSLAGLTEGESILLPGGWINKDGGHGMVYQFTRTNDGGYDFTVFNAGSGIENHEKKSSLDKELYNPTKTWHFPKPESAKENEELVFFIARLLKTRVKSLPEHKQRPFSGKRLYKETLASISYIRGMEVPAKKIPEHAYTAGQLSGTCAQRCLHQMLKINSASSRDYERFIFKFKQHALFDYANLCLDKRTEPYTASVRDQINLAIENNLKILNSPGLFDEAEIQFHLGKFAEIKDKLERTAYTKPPPQVVIDDPIPNLSINNTNKVAVAPSLTQPSYDKPPKPIDFGTGKNFLQNLERFVKEINLIKDPALQYYHLEKLLTTLPTETSDPFYQELKYLNEYEAFGNHIDKIQELLHSLQEKWLKGAQTPALQVMTLCTATIQMNIEDTIARTKKLPSFKPFIETTLHTLLGNKARNPFYATNHPILDKKFKDLEKRFQTSPTMTHAHFFNYFKELLATEATLTEELTLAYDKKYGTETSELHENIRKNGLKALCILSENLKSNSLSAKFTPLIAKVKAHLAYEIKLRAVINPFFEQKLDRSDLQFIMSKDQFLLYSPLYASFLPWQALSTAITQNKYALEDSPARDALMADVSEKSFQTPLKVKSANAIQLSPVKPIADQEDTPAVTQADIVARDYFHLRSKPSLQIPLTLDYFTRNIAKLSKEADQRYVEANLFQPGLLLEACKTAIFLPQFDEFLKTGFRFYNKEGQFTRESLFFVHLNYKVSRYLAMTGANDGAVHLQALHELLVKQLALPNTQEVTYVLQQRLFLTLLTRIELGEQSEELFASAFEAFFYIQSHANPFILEDLTHRMEVEKAIAQFQTLIMQQSPALIRNTLRETLAKNPSTQDLKLVEDAFPIYTLLDREGKKIKANTLLGKLFEGGLARSGVPFTLQKHPLIKHLGLDNIQECLMSEDGKYLVLEHETNKVYLYYANDQLTVQKVWKIRGREEIYELEPMTDDHLAKHANSTLQPINANLPEVLIDGSMDFWRPIKHLDSTSGLLVKNNVPVYSSRGTQFFALDKDQQETSFSLGQLNKQARALINAFESNRFIVIQKNPMGHTIVKLLRYDLILEMKPNESYFVHQATGEQLIESSPIHASVAGMVLASKDNSGTVHSRYLVPVARFYATEQGVEQSDFYPAIHDTQGIIAKARLEEEWKRKPPLQKPQWDYENSEKYISLRIQGGEPIADTVADALYLAYIYLATHQPEKSWKILEDCNTRLGGLTGDPAELQYIRWICKDLPHCLPAMSKKATKKTPPYVACQLKAMSLACDFLLQDRKFNLVEPQAANTANSTYARLEHRDLENFQKQLPSIIYKKFTRLQAMRRHMPHNYVLSIIERKRLLDYYHHTQEHQPRGTLGYEWLNLSLDLILQEKEALLARSKSYPLSETDKNRLALIEKHLKKFKAIHAKSSILELVSIDLSLPAKSTIQRAHLADSAVKALESWESKLSASGHKQFTPSALGSALELLSSNMSEEAFLANFPVYFQIAVLHENPRYSKRLVDFCSQTLLAHRHIPLTEQESNIPLLCNVLYRIAHNNSKAQKQFSKPEIKLTEVVSQVSHYPVPALQVYQAKDVYQEILATPEAILASQRPERIPLAVAELQDSSLLEQANIKKCLSELKYEDNQTLNNLVINFRQLYESGSIAISELTSEEEAGKILFELELKQKELASRIIGESSLAAFIQEIIGTEPLLIKKAENSWCAALELANQGPEDLALAQKWQLEKLAKSRPSLTRADLMAIYCRADRAFTIEKTGLNAGDAEKLQNLIHVALVEGIQAKLVKNIKENWTKAVATGDSNYAVKVLDALARESIPGLDKPSIVIIQHEEDILLRTRQVSALKALLERPNDGLGFKERIEKIIPGGGKSKVILPILAEEKAQGDNLVIIEVPPALLATNHVDFNRTSQRLFGKRAYRFEFNRDSDSSAARLEQLYHQFTEIMTTRSYLVTTGEAMQSLELKYIELLRSKERGEEWKQQVYWADKLTRLVRNYGDCIIDEVHQGLWLKKKLNYTSGEPKPLNPTLIKNAIAIFNLIDIEEIKNAPQLPDDYNWGPFKIKLAKKLIETNGPLHQFTDSAVLRYGSQTPQELIAYLTGTATKMPEAVINASPEEKETLAFFKRQVSELLSETLHRKLNVNYGPSKRENLSPTEYTLAIPYISNTVPNEQSRFGNELEAINLTMQMMLIKGISEELFKERILEWQALARQELFQNPIFTHLDQTPTARGFALLEKEQGHGLTLSQVNVDDPRQMHQLFERHRHNPSLIFPILQERSLKQIHHDGTIIPSDAFNHVDIYRSVQGVSGTPSNYTTFHQRLSYDPKTSLGSDDYIVEQLRSKKTRVSSLDYQTVAHFVDKVITNSPDRSRTRAIIDINATFTGVDNLDAAKAIASFIKKNQNYFSKPIKQVLYFNDEQVLCALNINDPENPIILGTSDEKEINRRLRSTPEERFTYYDQVHTLGADITQFEQAHAIVLVDEKVPFQAFIQGDMRMRGICLAQTLEFITPTRLNLTLDELVPCLKENDKKTLWLDNLFATKGQMANLLRRTALSFIQDIPSEDAESKAELESKFEPFFVDTPSLDLFALYGAINKEQALKDILGNHKNQLLGLWDECCKKANCPVDSKKLNLILEEVIKTAIPYCLPTYTCAEETHGKEVQVQKEVQKQAHVERIALNECFNAKLQEEKTLPWMHTIFQGNLRHRTMGLNRFCNTDPVFSGNLHASLNYAKTYIGQTEHANVFMKPVFLVWYHLEGQELHATLITPQEEEELARIIPLYKNSWIATTQDTVVNGKRPETMLDNEQYLSLREQVRFFNGEFASLLNQEQPLSWLQENASEKINFFENHLQVYRPGCDLELRQLKTALTQGNIEGFIYISQHPFEDLTEVNWKKLFPKTIAAQAAVYQKVAQAFMYLNQNALKEKIAIGTIQQQFNLPLNSLGFIEDHLNHLATINQLLQRIKKNPTKPFLTDLSSEEISCLEKCLGMPLPSFCEKQNINLSETNNASNLQVAGIEALRLMSSYPALQGNEAIMSCFKAIVKTISPQILCALLKATSPSPVLLADVLHNPACDHSVIKTILELPFPLDQSKLATVASKCQNKDLAQKLLERKKINTDILLILIKHRFLDETQLLLVLNHAKEQTVLSFVYNHVNAGTATRRAIYQHPALTGELVQFFLKQTNLYDEELLLILQHPTAIDETILETIATASTNDAVLLAVLSHPSTNYEVIKKILDNSHFSPAVALGILAHSEKLKLKPILLQNFTEKVFAQYNLQSSEGKEWENCLISLFEKYEKTDTSSTSLIQAIITQNAKSLRPRLSIHILRIFGPSMLQIIPLKQLIYVADEGTLRILVDMDKTGVLEESVLLLLAEKCQNHSQELIEAFLLRPDLTDKVLQQIYRHPEAKNAVHKKIFTHKALSSEFVETLLAQNELDDDAVLLILDHPTAIQEKTLALIAQGNFGKLVLNKVLSHSNTTDAVKSAIIDNPHFLPDMSQLIRSESTVFVNHELLTKLIGKAFERCQSDHLHKHVWENELVFIFEKYSPFRETRQEAEIIDLIKQHREIVSPKLGINILRQFGSCIVPHLPFTQMINAADNEELKILVDSNHTGPLPEELLVSLAQKCQVRTNTFQTFIERGDLTEPVLQTVLGHADLTANQLLIILAKAEEAPTLELVFEHPHTTIEVRKALFRHPALFLELIIAAFTTEIAKEEVTQIFQHPTAITVDVLKNIAGIAFDPHIQLEIVSHNEATNEVMGLVIKNEQFSSEVAQKIINRTTVEDDHELLQQLARQLFTQTRTIPSPKEQETCLVELLKKYSEANIKLTLTDMERIIREQPVTPQLGLHILRLFGKALLDHLPLEEMIPNAQPEDLMMLLEAQNADRFPKEILDLLVDACTTPELINSLLERNDLTVNNLKTIFDKVPSYESMKLILTHKKLSEETRNQWFEDLEGHYLALQRDARSKLEKLEAALERLKLKAYTHALRAIDDQDYVAAANTALDLHQVLRNEYASYCKTKNGHGFQTTCEEAIDKASNVLGEHRGNKQAFLDIINVVLAILTVYKLTQIGSGNWRFFKAKTESMEIATAVNDSIKDTILNTL